MKTIRLTVGQALIQFLDKQYINFDGEEIKYVDSVAGIFGHGCVLGIGEALEATDKHELKFYRVSNEQGAGHMALGFAKQSNRKRIMAATSSVGPGAMNMVTAAATATANRIPVLFLPGDIFATRQPDPVLQQVEQEYDHSISSNDAFRPVSKYWDRINRPEQLMTACINAMRVLTDPAMTGAVTICLPQDVAAEAYDYPVEFLAKRVHYFQRQPLASTMVERMATTIRGKKKPLLVLGGGVKYSEAEKQFMEFAEAHNIPFVETQAGKSAIGWDHPLNMGSIGTTGSQAANILAAETDCVIAVGTRLNDFHTASKWAFRHPDLDVIGINVNRMDAYKLNGLAAIADAKEALLALNDALGDYIAHYGSEYAELKEQWNLEVERLYDLGTNEAGLLSQTQVIGMMNRGGIDDNAIIVTAAGSLPSDLERIWRSHTHNSYHAEYGYSCMGYEIPGAIGAKIAEPDREVYVIIGDGTYLLYHQEIVMAIQEGIKINIVLLDNNGWQCIDNLQTGQGIPRFGCQLRFRNPKTDRLDGENVPIDFALNAQSYGAESYRAKTEAELKQVFEQMKQSNKTGLVDIKCPAKTMTDGYDTWWHAGVPEVSEHKAVVEASQVMKKHLKEAKKY
ncbi:MAG: 3D-(3,5/4)-trihydroxycyclohexane-1,2-dione acylhydrolase (decyclizing) [Alphaproteobacteria bacterium]